MRFCGHEGSAPWEECWTKIYAGKRTQKCNKNKKEKKRGSDIQADYIDKQCLDRMWHGCCESLF